MSNVTKQGVRDLGAIGSGSKKHLNGRKDKGSNQCLHVFENCVDENYLPFLRCKRCNFEPIL